MKHQRLPKRLLRPLERQAPLFSLFWENSKLNPFTDLQFARQLEEDAKTGHQTPQLFFSAPDYKLPPVPEGRVSLDAAMLRRKSGRAFGSQPLTEPDLSFLFTAFAHCGGQRPLPSAGAKYPVEIFAFLFNAEGPLNGKAVYYNADNHSLSITANAPAWDEIKAHCGLYVAGCPAALFIFAGFAERVTQKYGERGGRFFLIEAGQYAQNLALKIGARDLAGVEAGGLHDEAIKNFLGLEGSSALIALGFACGYPQKT